MTSYQKILYTVDQGIARITLNRPEKRNALDAELISEIRDALRDCTRDETVRVIVISGAGSDFCSGADLSGLEKNLQRGRAREYGRCAQHGGVVRGNAASSASDRRGGAGARLGRRMRVGHCVRPDSCQRIRKVRISGSKYRLCAGYGDGDSAPFADREKRAFELIASGEIITAQTALDFGLDQRGFRR